MLAWLTKSGGIPVVPLCLDGWQPRPGYALVHRECSDGGHLVGIGDPLCFNRPRALTEIADGWSVARNMPDFDPAALAREITWADVAFVHDLAGRIWRAPIIQSPDGTRAFRTAYGPGWLPALTPDQTRAEEITEAARNAFATGAPMSVACQWAAELISMTHHLTPEVIAACGLLDDTLVVAVLQAACSRDLEKGAASGV